MGSIRSTVERLHAVTSDHLIGGLSERNTSAMDHLQREQEYFRRREKESAAKMEHLNENAEFSSILPLTNKKPARNKQLRKSKIPKLNKPNRPHRGSPVKTTAKRNTHGYSRIHQNTKA